MAPRHLYGVKPLNYKISIREENGMYPYNGVLIKAFKDFDTAAKSPKRTKIMYHQRPKNQQL
jgi:hypothetical protein